MSIVKRIQNLCSRKNTTLIGLEREIGLGRGTIRNWDKNSPSNDKLQKVAIYFKVSLDYITYGYEYTQLRDLIEIVQNGRTEEQFAKDTGLDENWLFNFLMGISVERPSVDTLKRIASSNPVEYLVTLEDLLEAAGYKDENAKTDLPTLTPKDEREIARDLEAMINALDNKSGMAAFNESDDQEDQELLKASLLTSMRLAKQIAKKKYTPKKYRKE
ncbi:MAG: helix-turn-helix transcriptional regulator [Sporomusaceae bacterium]|nr:helix-turn-helix transcriptional regulator [Sporomusaceae bacterium]